MKALINNFISRWIQKEEKGQVVLDMGAGCIKALYLQGGIIRKFFIERNTPKPFTTVAEWIKKEGLLAHPVAVAVKGEETLARYIPFPRVDKKKLKEVFGYEISKFVPFNKTDVYLDVCVIDEHYSNTEFLVLLAVAKKAFLDNLIGGFREHKINIQTITLNTVALVNLFLHSQHHEDNTALLDIGAGSTLLNLMKKGVPCLSREIKVSIERFVRKAHQTAAKDQEKSEASDIHQIIASNPDLIKDISLDLSEEIKDSLDYFEANWGQNINRILLTGGLSKIAEIDSAIGESLGIKAEIWDPLEKCDADSRALISDHKEILAVALGLA